MESNKDEALRCLAIAQKHYNSENMASALKFARKSIALFPTDEADALMARLESFSAADGDASPQASTSATETNASDATAHRRRAAPSAKPNGPTSPSSSASPSPSTLKDKKKREYTIEQEKVVKRVRMCKHVDYYGILGLEKGCEDAAVKKAYRKLALQLHPDKNGAPGADEAFKMVSKAFTVLSDSDKRAAFDAHGADPDSRFSGMSSSAAGGGMSPGFGGFAGRGGGVYAEEVNPEELFNMFFGGGLGGPGASFGFGGPGVRTTFYGPGFQRTQFRRPAGAGRGAGGGRDEGQQGGPTLLLQLLPLLVLFLFSFMSYIPTLLSTPDPSFSFQPSKWHDLHRSTSNLNVPYWVNGAQWTSHPISTYTTTSASRSSHVRNSKLRDFESTVERSYVRGLQNACEREMEDRNRRLDNARGFFGIGSDAERVKQIVEERLDSCDALRGLGYVVR